MEDQGKWEIRIQALLAKAESTNSEEERTTILEKVEDLMAKWGIDRAVIEARRMAEGAPPKVSQLKMDFAGMRGQTRKDYLEAAYRIAMALGNMRGLRLNNFELRGNNHDLLLVGFESDLEAFSMLWSSLQMQMITGSVAWWKNEVMRDQGCAGFPAHVRSKMKSDYVYGYTNTVAHRLRDIRRRREQEASSDSSGSSALVLVDRGNLVDQQFNEMFPNLRKGRASTRNVGHGFTAGRRDGQNADLGQKRFAENKRQLS